MPYKYTDDHNACCRRWRKNHPAQGMKDNMLNNSKRYGLTHEECVEKRKQPCEICNQNAKKMCLDHAGLPNVFDGTFRGVLCQQCNTRLGWFERNKNVIHNYLVVGGRAF